MLFCQDGRSSLPHGENVIDCFTRYKFVISRCAEAVATGVCLWRAQIIHTYGQCQDSALRMESIGGLTPLNAIEFLTQPRSPTLHLSQGQAPNSQAPSIANASGICRQSGPLRQAVVPDDMDLYAGRLAASSASSRPICLHSRVTPQPLNMAILLLPLYLLHFVKNQNPK